MESQYQKWVNLSYLLFAGLVGYVIFSGAGHFAGAYDLEARVKNVDLIIRGGALLIGAIVFFVLYRNEQANQFMNEVVTELARVTWPTQKETSNATIIVLVAVVVSGMVLGLLDYIWTSLLKLVL
jgi:preprotein translocase subunit SecE